MSERHPAPARRLSAAVVALLVAIVLAATATPASAQGRRGGRGPREQFSKGGEPIKAAFRDATAAAARSTVWVKCDGKLAVLGTVVGADGWVVTKASELSGTITCTFRTSREVPATLIGFSDDHDLALLKVEATGLTPIVWGDPATAAVGQWVASAGPGDAPVAVGVLSVGRRRVPGRLGVIGVTLSDAADKAGAKVEQVVPDSPAQKSGVLTEDVITRLNDQDVNSLQKLKTIMQQYVPGQVIKITLLRAGKVMEMKAQLAAVVGEASRSDTMNRMGGELSVRGSGFPDAFQHDTVLAPTQCGGPLVGLDGKAVGVNIARAGRVETYALPADVVQKVVEQLKSAPPTVTTPVTARPSSPKSAPASPATRPDGGR